MARLVLLAAALGLTGCLFDDCSFDLEEARFNSALEAPTASVGDTLTVAFLSTFDPELDPFVAAGLEAAPPTRNDGAVRVSYQAEFSLFDASAPFRLDAVAVGDTAYVYVAGSLRPSLFSQACSPPQESVRLTVTGVAAPDGVRAIRTTRVRPEDLSDDAVQALLQRDDLRTISV